MGILDTASDFVKNPRDYVEGSEDMNIVGGSPFFASGMTGVGSLGAISKIGTTGRAVLGGSLLGLDATEEAGIVDDIIGGDDFEYDIEDYEPGYDDYEYQTDKDPSMIDPSGGGGLSPFAILAGAAITVWAVISWF